MFLTRRHGELVAFRSHFLLERVDVRDTKCNEISAAPTVWSNVAVRVRSLRWSGPWPVGGIGLDNAPDDGRKRCSAPYVLSFRMEWLLLAASVTRKCNFATAWRLQYQVGKLPLYFVLLA